MTAHNYTFTLILLILGISVTSLQAQDSTTGTRGYPAPKPSVEITDMQLLGPATKSATVTLQVRFRAHVDGPGSIMLRYPKHVAPPGRRSGEKSRTHSLTLKDGKQYVKTYPMRVEDTGGAMVSAIVRAEEAPENYDASDSEHINVVSGTETYQVFAPDDTTRRRVTATKGTAEKAQAKAQSLYTVSVNGKVEFLDENEIPDRMEGLYGSEVELWFRDSSTPDQLYHPLAEAEHVTYDEVEEDGQYHFDFSFSGDLSGYDELLILVGTSNDAATTSVGQGAWIKDSGDGTETFFGPSQGVAYDISGMGTDISISNADAEVNSEDGAILRHLQLSREFVEERYDNSVPFNLPVISVRREELSGLTAGMFCEPEDGCGSNDAPIIRIDPCCTGTLTTTHEYGHYVNHRMWGGGGGPNNDAPDQITEGWAIFYSFAARNYANEAYGDALRNDDDNTEFAPFRVDPTSGNRFDEIAYAEAGNPSFAAFASYLWSLYDGYSGGPFEVALYDDGDNDDVSGYWERVFEVFRTLRTVASLEEQVIDVPFYRYVFKEGYDGVGLGPLDNEVKTSVSSIGTFMLSNLSEVPDTPMRPPQLTSASGQIDTNGEVDFQWSQRTYPPGRDYGNYPDGYRLRKNGQVVATASFGATSLTYAPSGTNSGSYQLTAYNADGEARAAPTLDLGIDVTLSGPTFLNSGEAGTWSASVSDASSPSFAWQVQPTTSDSWNDKSCSGSSCSHTFTNPTSSTQSGRIRVTATDGSISDAAILKVFVSSGCEDGPCAESVTSDREVIALRDLQVRSPAGRATELSWKTSGPLTASTFLIEHRRDSTGAWSKIGTVEVADSIRTDVTGPLPNASRLTTWR